MSEMLNVSTPESDVRVELLERRARVAAVPGLGRRPDFRALLNEIDSALRRLDAQTFGLCEECHDPIETDRLARDPLVRVCLGCLTPAQQRALEHDLEMASLVQRALLPAEGVRAGRWEIGHRYRPLGPVSGDYCDVLPAASPDAPAHVILGDVSGKGVSASILMSHLHGVFRSLVTAEPSLAGIARQANRIFCEATRSNAFSTMLLGRLHPDGEVEVCNAGHLPPLWVRDGAVTTVDATGLPLGVFDGSEYGSTRFRLEPGDSLLLYTDGLSEALDDAGEPYGERRVEMFARGLDGEPAGAALDRCLAELDRYRGPASMEDDLTLMLVRLAS